MEKIKPFILNQKIVNDNNELPRAVADSYQKYLESRKPSTQVTSSPEGISPDSILVSDPTESAKPNDMNYLKYIAPNVTPAYQSGRKIYSLRLLSQLGKDPNIIEKESNYYTNGGRRSGPPTHFVKEIYKRDKNGNVTISQIDESGNVFDFTGDELFYTPDPAIVRDTDGSWSFTTNANMPLSYGVRTEAINKKLKEYRNSKIQKPMIELYTPSPNILFQTIDKYTGK